MKKGHLHQIHPVLPVQNVVEALKFYVNKLGFKIAFADDSKEPYYAGIIRDSVEIHLQWHHTKEWEQTVERPMLRIVTQNIDELYKEYELQGVFHKNTAIKETAWGTLEFAFFDPYKNGLTFYRDI